MSFGITEIMTLLLGMAGFGLEANPKAPTAEQALQYAIADPDIAVHVDAASVVPRNYRLLGQLADQPQIKASPELQKLVRQAIGEIEGARGMAKMMTGIDVTTDIADATGLYRIEPGADPSFVIAVHGKFSTQNLDKIATMAGKPAARQGTGTIVELGAGDPAVALTRDGVMLIGTPSLVRDRLGDGWKPPSHDAGTSLGHIAEAIKARPVVAIVLTMSQTARREALNHTGPRGFAADIITRHKAAALSMFHDGVGFTWIDSSPAGVDAMEQVAGGMLDLLRAAQLAPRGIARIAMGALDSYRGTSPQVDELVKHKADLMKIVETYTGNGSFKVAIDKSPKAMRLGVRATGKTISEVLPVGILLPVAIVGALAYREAAESQAQVAPTSSDTSAPSGKPPGANPPATKPPATKPPGANPPATKPPATKP